MTLVAGVDLGGTAVTYTLLDQQEKFLIDGLCEHPALVKQGPEVCLRQIADGLKIAADKAGVLLSDVVAVGVDTPGSAMRGPAQYAGCHEFCSSRIGRDSISARDWRRSLANRSPI